MPINLRNQNQALVIDQSELESLKEQINVAIVKELRSITRDVTCQAKISISRELFSYLQVKYGLKFKLQPNEQFVDDMRLVRANFKNERDYAKAECLTFALRKSRHVEYKSFKNEKLEIKLLSPLPYLSIRFFRNDKKLRK
jgi:hypothetical protein